MGRQFSATSFIPDLKMGITLASLSLYGKIPALILLFLIEAIYVFMVSPQCLNILGPIPLFSADLFMSNLSIIFLTSKGVINEMLNSESRKIELSLSFSDEKFCSWNSTFLIRFYIFTNCLLSSFMILMLPSTSSPEDFNICGISSFSLLSAKKIFFIYFSK